MNREQAEKLLAALIFDDLDEASKAELQAYLQTDDELRDRLADMRMAAKLTTAAVNDGPAPTLSADRLENLKRLAAIKVVKQPASYWRYVKAMAAVIIFLLFIGAILTPKLSRVRQYSTTVARSLRSYDIEMTGGTAVNVPFKPSTPSSGLAEATTDLYAANADVKQNEPVGGPPYAGGRMGGMGGYGADGSKVVADDTWSFSATGESRPSEGYELGKPLSQSEVIFESKSYSVPTYAGIPEAREPAASGPPIANSARFFDRTGDSEVAMFTLKSGRAADTPSNKALEWGVKTDSSSTLAAAQNQVPLMGDTPSASDVFHKAEQKRIEELYIGSLNAYSQGNYAEARRGFLEVQQSGLHNAAPGRRPQDYIATIDLLSSPTRPIAAPSSTVRAAGQDGDLTVGRDTEARLAELNAVKRTDIDKEKRTKELLDRAYAYEKEQKHEAALGQVDAALATDPLNNEALILKQTLDDTMYQRRQNTLSTKMKLERPNTLQNADEAMIAYSGEMNYPKNWRELVNSQFRKEDKPMDLDKENVRVAEQLEQKVDLSRLTPGTTFGEAIEVLRTSVEPPLSIQVVWRNLDEVAAIKRDTQVQVDGPRQVRLRDALDGLLRAATPAPSNQAQVDNPVSYHLENGVVTIAMRDNLPPTKLEVRVYDISDLASKPWDGLLASASPVTAEGTTSGTNNTTSGGGIAGSYGGMMGGMGAGMMGGGSMAMSLKGLIEQSVNPETWHENYPDTGEAQIALYPQSTSTKMAVSQTPEGHAKITKLLTELRKALNEQVARDTPVAGRGTTRAVRPGEENTGGAPIIAGLVPGSRQAESAPAAAKGADVKLEMNFRDAPVETVVKYLSEKGGLTTVASGGVPLDGRVTIISEKPVTVDEAVTMLNSTLKDRDAVAVRTGETLRVTTVARAKTMNLPVVHVTKDSDVPENNDQVMTFVIPVRYVDAATLSQNLISLLPEYATLEANRDGNALIMTDSASNVRRAMKIIQTLDTQLPSEASEVRTWRLTYGQASTTAQLLNNIFQSSSTSSRSSDRNGPFSGTLPDAGKVVAAADDRTNSIVVRAPKAALSIIDGMLMEVNKRTTDPNQPAVARPEVQPAEDADRVPAAARFKVVPVNPWVMTEKDSQSTFALDVDTASYALCRKYIRGGYLPPLGAVRMEEFVNAFDYAYPQRNDATFAVYADGAPSPFAPAGQDVTLLKIAVKARTVGRDQRKPAHLVFVVDVSASMGQPDRLPTVQAALSALADKLSEGDRVSLITCARDAALLLETVSAKDKNAIRQKIEAMQPAGPTNLIAGLKLGYATARKGFVAGQINQVVLCSDGVANIGQTDANDVLREVAADRKQGITITCVGVGYGAYNDAFLEGLANRGDGRYVFLDSGPEAQNALVGHLTSTLQTVATDARIQVQFNPSRVRRYRLIGYENRDIEDKKFRDDTVDAGEVGSGQCSTALYEVELTGTSAQDGAADIGTVYIRYRNADTSQIEEISRPLAGSIVRKRTVQEDPRFFLAAGAARFAEWLRQSEHVQHTTPADIQRVLDQVSAALPLDRDIKDLASLAHQADNLPRAP